MSTPQQISRINDALYEVHRGIAQPLSARDLARVAAYSEQHFHRVFKAVVGESVNVYIRRTRLEHAANQLMLDPHNSVQRVAEKCGFTSLSSFSKVFRSTFGVTPGAWRKSGTANHYRHYLADPDIATGYQRVKDQPLPEPEIIQLPPNRVAYVRHKGYGRSIKRAWQVLMAWALTQQIEGARQIGLHHSNPAWVPLDECRYVACIEVDKPVMRRGAVSSLKIPGGVHAVFDLSGQYGDLLPWIDKVLEQWLPTSGFHLQTTPAFVEYRENQFLSKRQAFDVRLFLPISLI